MAEKERFELSRRFSRPTPLAGAPLRPLEYFSVTLPQSAVFLLSADIHYYTQFFCLCQYLFANFPFSFLDFLISSSFHCLISLVFCRFDCFFAFSFVFSLFQSIFGALCRCFFVFSSEKFQKALYKRRKLCYNIYHRHFLSVHLSV